MAVEYDYRFWRRDEELSCRHTPSQVYGNILDESLSFVGRFENLQDDVRTIASFLGLKINNITHKAKLISDVAPYFENDEAKSHVRPLYALDFARFSYPV